MNKKLKRKDGSLTVYAFSCGYYEDTRGKDGDYLTLSLYGCWHIKGRIDNVSFWDTLDRENTKEARKLYNRLKKEELLK